MRRQSATTRAPFKLLSAGAPHELQYRPLSIWRINRRRIFSVVRLDSRMIDDLRG